MWVLWEGTRLDPLHPQQRWRGACEEGSGGFYQPVSCLGSSTGSTPTLPHLPRRAHSRHPKRLSCPVPPLSQPHSGWPEHPSSLPWLAGSLGSGDAGDGISALVPRGSAHPGGDRVCSEHLSHGCWELWQGPASGAGGSRGPASTCEPQPPLPQPRPKAGRAPGGCWMGEGWQCHTSAWHQIKEKCQNVIQPLALKSFIKKTNCSAC